FYSLIGKVISFGKDREEARLNLIKALQNFAIFGPATNRGFLLHLLQMKKFISGDFSTDLISKTSYRFDLAEGLRAIKALKSNPTQYLEDDLDLYSPWGAARASEPSADSEVYYEDFGDKRYFHTPFADFSSPRPDRGSSVQAASSETNEIEVRSPMPARVIKVLAKKGSRLKKGDVVLVLEAMKMEHQIKATKDSVLEDLFVKEGDRVQVDALLIKWGKDS
ncbi:MAG: carbamoyl-phosphate synthase subunit, partial [Bacteriovoracaceae bacterium]|nr:carbamoyl-phosphate synthase subunit [Bacteriovoracaceae bacterium]